MSGEVIYWVPLDSKYISSCVLIDHERHAEPWDAVDFIKAAQTTMFSLPVRGVVFIHWTTKPQVLGFVLFTEFERQMNVVRYAVSDVGLECGVEEFALGWLTERALSRRSRLDWIVREDDLERLAVLRKHGFLAREILRDYCTDGRDAYVMRIEVAEFVEGRR